MPTQNVYIRQTDRGKSSSKEGELLGRLIEYFRCTREKLVVFISLQLDYRFLNSHTHIWICRQAVEKPSLQLLANQTTNNSSPK
ncbi:unnamed protein product [Hymenolepis diminuta]|uniref:Uncharacterized protein n=1 Tax=Hymenolepis diminuta TaxID=6216 RepID=A0A564YLR6_HYMDI|nr:unnamed protein product [Hymenolepis diminuta]